MNLHQQLDQLAGPEVAPTMNDITADLDRGRRALRKRRTVQSVAGSAFAVAALAAGLAIAGTGGPAPSTPVVAQGSGSAAAATTLVAYKGEQPKGFTIDRVPAGWEIQNDNTGSLILAPENAPDQDPNSFVGKIGIFLQSKDETTEPVGKKVTVGTGTGVLVPEAEVGGSASDGATLWIKQPSGVHLQLQFWQGLGLSERDKLAIGAGVHVNKDAVQPVG